MNMKVGAVFTEADDGKVWKIKTESKILFGSKEAWNAPPIRTCQVGDWLWVWELTQQ